ncbi:hypothetical protein O1Q96_28090 [Streptomyces sp. Qhu-G9]|uniref:hypothetical protein n=1 Tax=Streptomyces sp. Qhu-G9 TaxID=3452799 RepID=UPI0022AC05B1|nr:hypothetical protein [Streptomyces aurantiacus]WAU83209.1 hypothetical protein O1Q96_28090 [Streptomyces aurantiacus]
MRFRISGETPHGPEETLALCAEAENYYVDRPPPARHQYELRDCAAEGELAHAAAQAQEDGSATLGSLTVHALDRYGKPVEPAWDVWCLKDARVLDVRPGFTDPSVVDVTVEGSLDAMAAGVDELPEVPGVPPLYQGFRLYGRDEEPWGSCRQVALMGRQPEPEPVPLRLLRCEPSGRLLAALESGDDRFDLGSAHLGPLDRTGRSIEEHWTCLHVESWSYSAAGASRVDLTLDVSCDDFRSSAARAAHELWSAGPPTEPNRWAALDSAGRAAWSRAAQHNSAARRGPEPLPNATYHLDGRHITDSGGFSLALGETMNGPGGYFGDCFGTIEYCLEEGHGGRRPFTLVWHDHHIARACLGRTPLTHDASPSFEQILEFFAQHRVDVLLD